MRENESDGEGGWRQPHEYVRPWAQRDEGHDEDEAARTRWPGANAAPPPEDGHQDTIAFGTPLQLIRPRRPGLLRPAW